MTVEDFVTDGGAGESVCIVMAGGGTGGHLAPGIAVADELHRRLPRARIVFFGTGRPVEERLIAPTGFELRVMGAVRMPRSLLKLPLFPLRLWQSIRRAAAALRRLRPAVVVGLGGYGAVPAVRAARRLGVPSVLLEQNSIPGRANRWLSTVAREVYVQFECSRSRFRRVDRVFVLGNPLRPGITEGSRERAIRSFSLDAARKTLLVLGGSQGAGSINRAVCAALETLESLGTLQVIHQTGTPDEKWVRVRHEQFRIPSYVSAFIDEMPDVLAAADLIVSRAGATTLAEIAAVGRASVLVPYPYAADDHQRLNAKTFEEAGAAVVIGDDELDGRRLGEAVSGLIADDTRRAQMAAAALTLARPDATRDVCDRILKLLRPPGT